MEKAKPWPWVQPLPSAADWWRRSLWVLCSPVFLHASVSTIFLHPVQLGLIISPQSDRFVMRLPQLVRWRIISEDETYFKSNYLFRCRSFHLTGLFSSLFHFTLPQSAPCCSETVGGHSCWEVGQTCSRTERLWGDTVGGLRLFMSINDSKKKT